MLCKPAPGRLAEVEAERFAALPAPQIAELTGDYNIYVAGVGGLGVLTIGALLGAAAHLEGKGVSVLDFTGLAQKNGAVVSQVRIAPRPGDLRAARIGPAMVDLILATDLVAATAHEALKTLSRERSAAVVNLDVAPTADAVVQRDFVLPIPAMLARLRRNAAPQRAFSLRAAGLAQALFGDTVAANTLMLGFAWQSGLVPLSAEAIARAIALNGAAVSLNQRAFNWGRAAAVDLAAVEAVAGLTPAEPAAPESLDALVERRAGDLALYQDGAYADRYRRLVAAARAAGQASGDAPEAFARAVATQAHRLMAYKDEYEVARLYADPAFKTELASQFSGARRLSVWLSPPLISPIDPATGRPKKRRFGPWVFTLFALLARLKRLRGTALDPFGATAERRVERRLMADYLALVEQLIAGLTPGRLAASIKLAAAVSDIRGFGPVKEKAIAAHAARLPTLLADLAAADQPIRHAAE